MIEQRLKGLWDRLQGKKPHFPHFLSGVRLQGIRGIEDLRVAFDYPVSVIAGGNASGKSTVLFAAACAYKVPGAGVKDFVPSTLFPFYLPKLGNRVDHKGEVVIEFDYSTLEGRKYMRWRRSKGWNKSYGGRRGAGQPERGVYLRTLSNFSNPSEARSVLNMSRLNAEPESKPLNASQIQFAQRILSFRYEEVVELSSGNKNLLFASQKGGARYSELHMAAGERSILRLSQEIAQRKEDLILIDGVEAGLHPWVQQLLMLHLQQLALRNDLQIIVTSHSPVVLDSVPPYARIFLERDTDGRVSVQRPYRDVIQDALYGRSSDKLNLLCEDDTAEAVLRGILDEIIPRLRIRGDAIRIGRNTVAEEFPTHAAAFKKFGQITNFIFVLDGDKQNSNLIEDIQRAAGTAVPVFFLPGNYAPEFWIWKCLRERTGEASKELKINSADLSEQINRQDAVYNFASDTPSQIAKSKLRSLSEAINQTTPDICRVVAQLEAERLDSDLQPLKVSIETAISQWRSERE